MKIPWIVGIILVCMGSMNHLAISMEMTAIPVQAEYLVGEPIQIGLQFKNMGAENADVYLPAIKVRVTAFPTTDITSENWLVSELEGGIRARGCFLVDVPPSGVRKISVFLDHFIRLDKIGTYILEIALDESTAATTEITLVPETPERLRELQTIYTGKWEQVEVLGREADTTLISFFSLSRHRFSVPYQIKLYESEIFEDLDWDERLDLAKALIASENVEAIAALVQDLRPESKRLMYNKGRIFVEFRKAGALDWSGELYSLIEPFRSDIESAIEYITSD